MKVYVVDVLTGNILSINIVDTDKMPSRWISDILNECKTLLGFSLSTTMKHPNDLQWFEGWLNGTEPKFILEVKKN